MRLLLAIMGFALLVGCKVGPAPTLYPGEFKTIQAEAGELQIAFSPGGTWLAVSTACKNSPCGKENHLIQLFQYSVEQTPRAITTGKACVYAFAFTSDGKLLAATCADNTLRIWNVESGSEIHSVAGACGPVSFCPSTTMVTCATPDNRIKIIDADSGVEVKTIGGNQDKICAISFASSGKTVVAGSADQRVKIWDIETGKDLRTIAWHIRPISALRHSPDGRQIVTSSWDGTIKFWDVNSSTEVRSISGHKEEISGFCFSPDGKYVASIEACVASCGVNSHALKIWDASDGKMLKHLWVSKQGLTSVSFSSEGRYLAVASRDGTIKIYDFPMLLKS